MQKVANEFVGGGVDRAVILESAVVYLNVCVCCVCTVQCMHLLQPLSNTGSDYNGNDYI